MKRLDLSDPRVVEAFAEALMDAKIGREVELARIVDPADRQKLEGDELWPTLRVGDRLYSGSFSVTGVVRSIDEGLIVVEWLDATPLYSTRVHRRSPMANSFRLAG